MPNRTIHEIRYGLIMARIWQRHSRAGLRHTVAVTRLYRDGDIWKHSSRFMRDDLPLVGFVLDQAHTWIYQQSAATGADTDLGAAASRRAERQA